MRLVSVLLPFVCLACAHTPEPELRSTHRFHRGLVPNTPPEIVPPAGFVPGDNGLNDVFVSDGIDRVGVWSADDDMGFVMLEVFHHPPVTAREVDAWAVTLARRYAGAELEDVDVPHEFNYYSAWVDDSGRRVVEWGWVWKGERMETYDRLVAGRDKVWHVRLSINGTSTPRLGPWLSAVFDQSFGLPASPVRRILWREYSSR